MRLCAGLASAGIAGDVQGVAFVDEKPESARTQVAASRIGAVAGKALVDLGLPIIRST